MYLLSLTNALFCSPMCAVQLMSDNETSSPMSQLMKALSFKMSCHVGGVPVSVSVIGELCDVIN